MLSAECSVLSAECFSSSVSACCEPLPEPFGDREVPAADAGGLAVSSVTPHAIVWTPLVRGVGSKVNTPSAS